MPVDLVLVSSMDGILEPGPGVAYCTLSCSVVPRFAEPFPIDRTRLVFDGAPVPCFGVWHGLAPDQRARLAAELRLLRVRSPADFVVELLSVEAGRRIVIARIPGAITLAAASATIERALRSPGGAIGRLLGRDRLGPLDGVRLPVVQATATDGARTVEVDIGSGGPEQPVPASITLGRGDAYRRSIECNGPFYLWVGDSRSLQPQLVARIAAV